MTATERALELTKAGAQAAADKQGNNIVAYDVSEQLVITDVFLLVSATNERQVGAIVDGVEERLREFGAKPVRREGDQERRWVLLDFGEIVVHIQHSEERTLYALERLWGDCPAVELDIDDEARGDSGPREISRHRVDSALANEAEKPAEAEQSTKAEQTEAGQE